MSSDNFPRNSRLCFKFEIIPVVRRYTHNLENPDHHDRDWLLRASGWATSRDEDIEVWDY